MGNEELIKLIYSSNEKANINKNNIDKIHDKLETSISKNNYLEKEFKDKIEMLETEISELKKEIKDFKENYFKYLFEYINNKSEEQNDK